ncbi:hypothetical protein FRC10_005698 [Ceratobasidium sp. 414]|nr:hypothetical protein FRC10_005698 [Ceratobasidium sp. 414]
MLPPRLSTEDLEKDGCKVHEQWSVSLRKQNRHLALVGSRASPSQPMSDTATGDEQGSRKLVVMILCGLVGSGKASNEQSAFANALQREFPEFRRCNQDELGRRGDVERAVHAALSRGLSVCVDRTNIDPGQRRTWIEIAHQYPDVEIWGVLMDTPYEICSKRLAERTDHPTIKSPQQAQQVLSRFANDFVPIDASEGFNRVYRLPPHHSPDFTHEELEEILAAIQATAFYDAPLSAAPQMYPSRSRGPYPNRGRGRGRGADQSHDWRSSPSTAGPHAWGANPTPGAWVPSQARGGWRNQDTSSRGLGGDNRGSYRGRYSRGRGGWNRASYGHQASRGGPMPSRGRGSYQDGRSEPLGATPAQDGTVSASDGGSQTADIADSGSVHPTRVDAEPDLETPGSV